jgi:hypothetical protein
MDFFLRFVVLIDVSVFSLGEFVLVGRKTRYGSGL